MGVYKLKSFLALLCQDLWVLTPHPPLPSVFIAFLGTLIFLEKVVDPDLQGLYVATPVTCIHTGVAMLTVTILTIILTIRSEGKHEDNRCQTSLIKTFQIVTDK